MKKIIIPTLCVLLLATSCKKDEDTPLAIAKKTLTKPALIDSVLPQVI